MVASSSAGFFSSITPKGRPLTNSTTSGRRVFLFSVTLNWLTASQSLLAGILEVEHADLVSTHDALGIAIFDLDAVHEHPVERAVARIHGRALWQSQLPKGVPEPVVWDAGVELAQNVSKSALQDHLRIVAALGIGGVRRDVRPMSPVPAKALQPGERGVLNVSFGERDQE